MGIYTDLDLVREGKSIVSVHITRGFYTDRLQDLRSPLTLSELESLIEIGELYLDFCQSIPSGNCFHGQDPFDMEYSITSVLPSLEEMRSQYQEGDEIVFDDRFYCEM